MKYFVGALVGVVCLLLAGGANALISKVEAQDEGSGCSIKFDAAGDYKYRTFVLSNPPRLVVDIETGAQGSEAAEILSCGCISGIRQSWFDKTRYRFVFDAEKNVEIGTYSAASADGGYSINISISEKGKMPPEIPIVTKEKEPEESFGTKLKTKYEAKQETSKLEESVEEEKPAPKKKAIDKKSVVSPIIVIDPGHGGVDPGAMGESGVQEKDVVLEFAHELRRALIATGRYKVRQTRQGDVYVKLPERIEKARELEGDLFISIHADAAPEKSAKGLSVYTLSEKAADKLSENITASPKNGDFIQGIDLTDKSKEVAGILIDLAERENLNRSAEFANVVIKTMQSKKVKLLNNTHRFAGYVVLKSPDVPAVLLELGFLSNHEDERKLQNASYRKLVVTGLMKSIDEYFAKNPVYSGK